MSCHIEAFDGKEHIHCGCWFSDEQSAMEYMRYLARRKMYGAAEFKIIKD